MCVCARLRAELWSAPVSHLFPSVTWRLFLNGDAIVMSSIISMGEKCAYGCVYRFADVCAYCTVCAWFTFFLCLRCSCAWLSLCMLVLGMCVCGNRTHIIAVLFVLLYLVGVNGNTGGGREGIILLYRFLQPTGTLLSPLAGKHTHINKHTQTHNPTNHEIVMSDLLIPLDSTNCIPAWSCSLHRNTHT